MAEELGGKYTKTGSQERLRDEGTLQSQGEKSLDEEMPLMRKTAADDDVKQTKPPPPGSIVSCCIVLPDGSACDVDISKQATGQQLVDKICEKLNLLEKEYFSCTFVKRDVKFWLKMDKSIKKQIKGEPWKFLFEVKFYPVDPTLLHEELTRYQIYLQVREDVCEGKLPCSFMTLALLGSYACVSQLGEYDVDEHGSGIEYIKRVRFAPTQTEELLERISELHRTHRGQTPGEAELYYLENAKNMALYGIHMHEAVNVHGELVNVGVGAAGLVVYKDRVRLNRFVWAKILKISYKRNVFIIQIRPSQDELGGDGGEVLLHRFKLLNLVMAKRLWRLAVEHHAFFRLREPEKGERRRFSMVGYKYRFTGRTQYQSQQAADQINRSSQSVNRVAGDRFTWDRTLDPGTPYSVDRSEEVVMEGYRTTTLDLKRRNRSSVPYADTEDDDGSRAQLIAGKDAVAYHKTTHMSTSSSGDVFLTLPGQETPEPYGGTAYDARNAGRTPYPRDTDVVQGYMTPGYDPNKGVDDFRRELDADEVDSFNQQFQNGGYGADRYGAQRTAGYEVNGMGGESEQSGYGRQDDHLKVQAHMTGAAAGDGSWTEGVTTRTKTTTRKYTDSDGTLITEHRTEKEGVVETHIEKRTRSVDLDMDHDRALAEAIFAVTEMNPDLTVAKIEIQTKAE